MRILKFLTSRIGAISVSAGRTAGMAVTVGLIGFNVYNFASNTPAAQEQQIRSLSSIMSTGGALPAEYSGINFDTGNVQFATAEEIAAKEGTLFDGGEGAVNALNNISVPSYALGSGEAGLGMGANAAAQVGPDGKPLTGNVSADGSAVGAAAAQQAQKTQINKLGEEKPGGLQRASIAKASGSNMGSSSSGGFGGTSSSRSGQSAAASRASALGTSDGYTLSGAMPKGSTLLASNGNIRGAASSSSSFIAGNTRTRIGQGSNSKEGRSLRDIALASSKVAANKDRAANEGASPFMAKEKLSGGIQVVGETANEFAGSSDASFEDKLQGQEAALGQAVEEIDTTEQERKAHRDRLATNLISLLFTTVAAMLTIAALKKVPWPWATAAAYILGGVMLAVIALYLVDAFRYADKYGWPGDAWAFIGGGALFATGVSLAMFSPTVTNWLAKIYAKVFSWLGMGVRAAVVTTGMAAVGGIVKGAVDSGKSIAASNDETGTLDNK